MFELEKLKMALLEKGHEAVENFIGNKTDETDPAVLSGLIDDAYAQMPDDVFGVFYHHYALEGDDRHVVGVSTEALWDELLRRYEREDMPVSAAASWPLIVLPDSAVGLLKRIKNRFQKYNKSFGCGAGGIVLSQSVMDKLPFKDEIYEMGEETDYIMDDPDLKLELVGGNHPALSELWDSIGLDPAEYQRIFGREA